MVHRAFDEFSLPSYRNKAEFYVPSQQPFLEAATITTSISKNLKQTNTVELSTTREATTCAATR
jgi:hypothetical protein